jgi:hypothetical protein
MAVGRPQPLSGRSIAYEFERQGLGFVAGQQIWQVSHASGRIGGQGAGDVNPRRRVAGCDHEQGEMIAATATPKRISRRHRDVPGSACADHEAQKKPRWEPDFLHP